MASSSSLLGFHFKPHLFRCGNGWILLDFFYLGDGQLQAGASRKFLSWGSRMSCGVSWVQDEAEERPPGSALCCGGTFVLKGGRRGDDAQSPWQQQCRDAGDTAVQRCWGAAGGLLSSSQAEFQHFRSCGLPRSGSAQPGFENRNIPEIQKIF